MKAKEFIKKMKFVENMDSEMSADRQDAYEMDKEEKSEKDLQVDSCDKKDMEEDAQMARHIANQINDLKSKRNDLMNKMDKLREKQKNTADDKQYASAEKQLAVMRDESQKIGDQIEALAKKKVAARKSESVSSEVLSAMRDLRDCIGKMKQIDPILDYCETRIPVPIHMYDLREAVAEKIKELKAVKEEDVVDFLGDSKNESNYRPDNDATEFYLFVVDGSKEGTVHLLKDSGRWKEFVIDGDLDKSKFHKTYQSYMKPQDILTWFKRDFESAMFVEGESENESAASKSESTVVKNEAFDKSALQRALDSIQVVDEFIFLLKEVRDYGGEQLPVGFHGKSFLAAMQQAIKAYEAGA